MERGSRGDQRDYNQPPPRNKNIREMLYLAESAAEGGIKVLPGKEWAFHYPVPVEHRQERLQGLMAGKYKPEQVVNELRPDALIYNVGDLETQGLEAVSARILNETSRAAHYDYTRFANFVSDMQGVDVDIDTVTTLYDGVTNTRIQKKLRDAYGSTGQRQMETVLRQEAQDSLAKFASLSSTDKVLTALKLDWLCEDFGYVSTAERDQAVAQLSGSERELFNRLSENYRQYVHKGDESAYRELKKGVREDLPAIQKSADDTGEASESMQELEKELEKYQDEAVPPGTPKDSAIPPEDRDEYHTPDIPPGESKETVAAQAIFEIEPPLGGFYAAGRKSHFDIDTKTWSKKKQIQSYDGRISTAKKHRLSGTTDQGIKSIPIPNSYALDTVTLKYSGAKPEFFRDQNGCFYIQTNGRSEFSIEFGKEDKLFIGPPIPEDTAPLYRGQLSPKTENQIHRLTGTPAQKAEQARSYVLANHFYPGGGDLQAAGALQAKLRHESTGDNYLQNIDSSEYLECYSANTKFIAMMRRAGVPARLVIGHKVEGSSGGKSQITQSTGHAWSEIWDGREWIRFDATPLPKPEDKKDKKEDEKQESAEQANDGGVEQPGKQESQEPGSSQQNQMPEAGDDQISQAQKDLQQAQETMDKISKVKEQLDKMVDEAKSFKDLDQAQKQTDQTDIFDDMKEDLKEKIEAKEEQMKGEIKDQLDKMVDDGFLDENRREELEKLLEEKQLTELDRIKEQIERENKLYNEYDDIREEVMPLVDQWFEYFVQRLPRQEDIQMDEDSRTRQGSYDRRSVQKARNLIFGTIKNPRVIRSEVKPLFLASIMLDVSGSMAGEKLNNARKLLVFYSELFSRIREVFGYIKFSINVFSDNLKEIKGYEQDYNSPKSYIFPDGSKSTVKVRLMQSLKATGGTNMLDPIRKAAADLSELAKANPNYASAFYFVGDGEDTNGNSGNVKKFLEMNDAERGFGDHMRSAIMLGNESQRQTLAQIFGDEHTTVAPDFDSLIEQSMLKFDEDIEEYLKQKVG